MSFQDYSESLKGRMRLGSVNAKALAGAVVLLLAAGIVVAVNVAGAAEREPLDIQRADAAQEAAEGETPEAPPALICVHVDGCVARPGIVYVEEGSRVADAVEAAGGMTAEASSAGMNLARVLADGEQVLVQGAAAADAAVQGASGTSAAGASATSPAASSGKVNINTATAADLQALSGIGPSKAQKIVDHREASGPFKSVDGLLDVSGIGEKTLESIRDQVCV